MNGLRFIDSSVRFWDFAGRRLSRSVCKVVRPIWPLFVRCWPCQSGWGSENALLALCVHVFQFTINWAVGRCSQQSKTPFCSFLPSPDLCEGSGPLRRVNLPPWPSAGDSSVSPTGQCWKIQICRFYDKVDPCSWTTDPWSSLFTRWIFSNTLRHAARKSEALSSQFLSGLRWGDSNSRCYNYLI